MGLGSPDLRPNGSTLNTKIICRMLKLHAKKILGQEIAGDVLGVRISLYRRVYVSS